MTPQNELKQASYRATLSLSGFIVLIRGKKKTRVEKFKKDPEFWRESLWMEF